MRYTTDSLDSAGANSPIRCGLDQTAPDFRFGKLLSEPCGLRGRAVFSEIRDKMRRSIMPSGESRKEMARNRHAFATRAVHAGGGPDPTTGAVAAPIYATSTYAQESPGVHKGYEYARTSNPTRAALERCV